MRSLRPQATATPASQTFYMKQMELAAGIPGNRTRATPPLNSVGFLARVVLVRVSFAVAATASNRNTRVTNFLHKTDGTCCCNTWQPDANDPTTEFSLAACLARCQATNATIARICCTGFTLGRCRRPSMGSTPKTAHFWGTRRATFESTTFPSMFCHPCQAHCFVRTHMRK